MNKQVEIIIAVILIFLLGLIIGREYRAFVKMDNYGKESKQALIKKCQEEYDLETSTPDFKARCDEVRNENHETNYDFYTMFMNVTLFGFTKISMFLSLVLLIPALIPISKYLKNAIIKNEINRLKYKKIIQKQLAKVYKYSLVFPIVIAISFALCLLYTKNLDPTYAIIHSTVGWSENTMNSPLLFMLFYLLNVWIHSILYLNIGVLIVRKYHNYFVAVILSFLSIIGIEAFLEIFFNAIVFTILLHSDFGIIFNIMNMMAFNDQFGFGSCMIIPLLLMAITSIMVVYAYKKQENLIIDCEANS